MYLFIPLLIFLVTTPITTTGHVCNGVAFIHEMTAFIDEPKTQKFFNLVTRLLPLIDNQITSYSMSYTYSQFGTNVYLPLRLTDINTVTALVNNSWNKYNTTMLPKGYSTYTGVMLQDLKYFIKNNYPEGGLNVLIYSEMNTVRDVNKAFVEAQDISKLPANVYIVDYSSIDIKVNLWSIMTNNNTAHVINGTSMDTEQLYAKLSDTFVKDIVNNHCY